MSFIGIISEGKKENYIKQILSKELKDKTIIFLNAQSIENLKNIKFETIIMMSNNEKIFSKKEIVKNIIAKAKYLVINADEEINLDLLENMSLNVITYGFNSKSTITTSSVKEEGILLCVQRSIQDLNKNEIEPQEISIQKNTERVATDLIMGISAILLLYGIQKFKI